MTRGWMALGCGLLLTLPGYAAPVAESPTATEPLPELVVMPVSLDYPDVTLETVILDDWRLRVGLPEGWIVEDSGDILRFRAPEHLPNCGISLVEEPQITKATFFETVWYQMASETGMHPQAAGLAKVGPIAVPLIWATVDLEAEQPVSFRQITAFYEFSPDEYPFLATASAPESLWPKAAPEIESILGHIVPLATEEDAFADLEGQPGS